MNKPLLTALALFALPQASWAFSCADVVSLQNQGLSTLEIQKRAIADGKDAPFVHACLASHQQQLQAQRVIAEAQARAEATRQASDDASEAEEISLDSAPEPMLSRSKAKESSASGRTRHARPMPKKRRPMRPMAPAPSVAGGAYGAPISRPPPPPPPRDVVSNSEDYEDYGVNGFVLSSSDNQSTFSVDVDTASYAIARSKIQSSRLPPEAAVRVEEFVNAFDYNYAQPKSGPFDVHMEAAPHPFVANHHVLRVGVQGRALRGERKPVHLTFLVDVSGSMSSPNKLGLAQKALHHLVDNLGPEDTVALATYAGSDRIVLQPTYTTRKAKIHAAIDGLRSGGGTAMNSGMEAAYKLAKDNYLPSVENRVIVLSDGDANIGRSSQDEILKTIKRYANEGITLTTVGLGMGNYKDVMMEQLANKGDGNYYYLDSYKEAQKVFGEDLSGTIETIARDVKIQVEFDPEAVRSYRLVGYENRDIADKDFRKDEVDAGEVGSGHQVTALYEVVLADNVKDKAALATLRMRAKPPGPDAPAKEYSWSVPVDALGGEFEEAGPDTRMAWTVATFAEKLRGSPYASEVSWGQIAQMARDANQGTEDHTELIDLIDRASQLDRRGGFVSR